MTTRPIHVLTTAMFLLAAATPVTAQEQIPAILEPADLTTSSYEPPRHVSRFDPVAIRWETLAEARVGDEILLNLFEDARFIGMVDRVDRRSETGWTVAGRLDGIEHSAFAIVVQDAVAVALIDAGVLGQRFKLRYLADGVHFITEIYEPGFGGCATEDEGGVGLGGNNEGNHGAAGPGASQDGSDAGEDDGSEPTGGCNEPVATFDLLIYYTTLAKNAAGGTSAIQAECQLAIEGMNTGYANSGINAVGRLVAMGETSYNESGDFGDHRDRMQDPDDGVMDGIPTARDTYTADLVSLWVDDDDAGTICGKAFCTPDSDYAYQVSNWDCAVSNFTFQHEHGHLQGCAHNSEDAGSGCNWYGYSYGWRFFGNSGSGWRTVMAYNNEAEDYRRINWFSNPSVFYDGVRTGVTDEADNERTINNRRRTVEDWRFSRYDVWVQFGNPIFEFGTFDNPYNTVAEGVSRCATGGLVRPTLHVKSGTTSETLTINKDLVLNSCGGTAVIGQQ
ncbi:MAG: hypothetical protein IT449_01780 [Phycisphaerales bacterium]|nr:hypothetical protein [Phycisphaerales bacterium]